MLRTKHDDIFSKLVRERADWTCEYCCKEFHNNRGGLHCSHVYGRRRASVRYHPLNAMAHCIYCHKYLGENPLLFASHYASLRTPDEQAELILLANEVKKWEKPSKKTGYKGEKEELYMHYKDELLRLTSLRKDGVTGWIEFTYLTE